MRYVVAFLTVAVALALGASATASAPARADVAAVSPSAGAAMPALYRSCARFNAKYPHGVGKAKATDTTKGSSPPVTTFKRSTKLYNLAMSNNKGLDRDKDGVACEKA